MFKTLPVLPVFWGNDIPSQWTLLITCPAEASTFPLPGAMVQGMFGALLGDSNKAFLHNKGKMSHQPYFPSKGCFCPEFE